MKDQNIIVAIVLAIVAILIISENASGASSSSSPATGCTSTGEMSTQQGEQCVIELCPNGSYCVGVQTGTVYGT